MSHQAAAPRQREAAPLAGSAPIPAGIAPPRETARWSVVRGTWGAIRGRTEALPASRFGRFAFFVFFSSLPYLLVGQTWLLAGWALRSAAAGSRLPLPDFGAVSTIPGRLVAFHGLCLLTYWLPGRWLLRAAVAGALGLGLALRIIDVPSVAALALVALLFYGLFRLPIPRWGMLLAIVAGAPALQYVSGLFGWTALARSGLTIGLIVVLWYACYQITTRKPLGIGKYLAFVKTRLFMEGPVFTPGEFKLAERDALDQTRLAGVRVIGIALLARTAGQILGAYLAATPWRETTGLALLGYSYLNYLVLSFEVVFSYNLALGLLRFFGLPVRDNFYYWILARTPNEHWRRWNLLFREWLITFTFYPLMRAKVHLFLCIMATLMASGGLHVLAHAADGSLTFTDLTLTLTYWCMNGLAIYLVVDFPRRFPALTKRAGLEDSKLWWGAGWVLTSAFYAVMFYVNRECQSLADVPAYFVRLFGGGA